MIVISQKRVFIRLSQIMPSYPSSQLHSNAFEHVPCTHPGKRMHSSQNWPVLHKNMKYSKVRNKTKRFLVHVFPEWLTILHRRYKQMALSIFHSHKFYCLRHKEVFCTQLKCHSILVGNEHFLSHHNNRSQLPKISLQNH